MNPLDRRSFLLMTGTALTAPAHQWLIASPVTDAAHPGRRNITVELVDQLDGTVDQLRRLDDQIGGAPLLDLVRHQTNRVVDLLDNGRYDDTVGRRLHSTAAELLRLAGWTCHDADRNAEAQRYFVAALHAAHAAGDQALGAGILHYMSIQAAHLGRAREAVTLAETARSGYPGASPRVRTLLDLAAAQAHAAAREQHETERAIGAAHDAFSATPPSHGEPDWCYWVGQSDICEHAGFSYLFLHDWTRASDHLTASLREQEPGRARESALRHIVLAGAYAEQGEPEQACETGGNAIDLLSGQVDSPRCVDRLGQLTGQLSPYRTLPAVRAFGERTRELVTAGTGPA